MLFFKQLSISLIFLTAFSFASDDYVSVTAFEMLDKSYIEESNNSSEIFKDIDISLLFFKSSDNNITIKNIATYQNRFIPITKEEKFKDRNSTYWVRIDLGDSFPSGRFVYTYGDIGFSEHTFKSIQQVEYFVLGNVKHLKFTYLKGRDSSVYYFKIAPTHYKNSYRFLVVSTAEYFYQDIDKGFFMFFILGGVLGLIIMAGLYNGAMYFYNRDRAFLDYALMQFFIAIVLFNMTSILDSLDSFLARDERYYGFISLIAFLFSIFFAKSFFNSSKYTPKLDRVLNFGVAFIVVDIVINFFTIPLTFQYSLMPFFGLIYLLLGYIRLKQGFKPAKFYLIGWTVLIITLFIDSFWLREFIVSPLYFGSAIEAILLSLALSYKVKMIADEKEQQKEMLIHQSKLASMGEMIGNIAHQWRQPLTHLSYTVMNIEDAFKHNALDEKYLTKKVTEANMQIEFMSQTIDDFKNFYAPSKLKESFSLAEESQAVLEIMNHALKGIEVDLYISCDAIIDNYKNEYKQVLLNLISNAKDALIQREIGSPKIDIMVRHRLVTVSDNAGGIEERDINKIFEPYFTTKDNSSGIGLYMSKMIIEKNMQGAIKVSNSEDGAVFEIIF